MTLGDQPEWLSIPSEHGGLGSYLAAAVVLC